MKTLEIPKSGKCGDRVWQRNRYCQYSYPAFIPFNPRSPGQVAVRGAFSAVSKRWRTLTQEQRDVWIAVGATIMSKPRLDQCGPLTGCQLFVKTNVALVNQGKPQVDLPEGTTKQKECRKAPSKAIPGNPGPEHPASNDGPKCGRRRFEVGSSMFDVRCSQSSRGGESLLRYRACTGVPPYLHHSSTLAGRWDRRYPPTRLRLPCPTHSPRCRSPTRGRADALKP
jgi:hypothetical protein